jgi:hypothetical protein
VEGANADKGETEDVGKMRESLVDIRDELMQNKLHNQELKIIIIYNKNNIILLSKYILT